jgi:hypothetical protein
MAAEIWARNPINYIRECRETDLLRFAWDRGTLHKHGTDAQRHAFYYLGNVNFRALAIGPQGAAEYDRTHGLDNPFAVYPVWEYGKASIDLLERWMAEDCTAQLRDRALDRDRPVDEVPVLGQQHRVIVTQPPPCTTGDGRRFLATLGHLQADYPDSILHVHGYATIRWIGALIKAGSLNPRLPAASGRVLLPNGSYIERDDAPHHLKWISMLGWKCAELEVPRNRTMFSIQAAQWAAQNWDTRIEAIQPKGRKQVIDSTAFADILDLVPLEPGVEVPLKQKKLRPPPDHSHAPRKIRSPQLVTVPLAGDRFYCEACSHAKTCRSFRVGSICSLPDSEAKELAQFFKSRDSDMIIEGLGRIIEGGVERYVEGRQAEKISGELDPRVTKLEGQVFTQGVALAKLVDPKLRSAGLAVQVNGGNGVQVNGVTPGGTSQTINARVADAYAALEAAGVPGSMITETMLERCLQTGTDRDAMQRICIEEAAQYALPSGLIDVDEAQAP